MLYVLSTLWIHYPAEMLTVGFYSLVLGVTFRLYLGVQLISHGSEMSVKLLCLVIVLSVPLAESAVKLGTNGGEVIMMLLDNTTNLVGALIE